MDSQHQFEIEGFVAALSLIIVRLDDSFPLAPRYDAIDLPEKFLIRYNILRTFENGSPERVSCC